MPQHRCKLAERACPFLVLAACVAAAACSSMPTSPPPGPIIVPATSESGRPSLLRFDEGVVTKRTRDGGAWNETWSEPVPLTSGRPVCASIDLVQRESCAAYENGVLFADLESHIVTRVGFEPSGVVRSVATRNGRAAVVVDAAGVQLVRRGSAGGRSNHDLRGLLRAHGMTWIDRAVPLADDRLLLLCSEAAGEAGHDKVRLLVVDLGAPGGAHVVDDRAIGEINVVGDCECVGDLLYVAGSHDQLQPGAGGGLFQRLVLLAVDLDSLERRVVHDSGRQRATAALSNEVVDLAARSDVVALLMKDGRVLVQPLQDDGVTPERPASIAHVIRSGARSIALVSDSQYVALGDRGDARLLDLRR